MFVVKALLYLIKMSFESDHQAKSTPCHFHYVKTLQQQTASQRSHENEIRQGKALLRYF